MLVLLVLKTGLSGMCRPTSETPSALDLISMLGAMIEVVAHAIATEVTTAAFRHDVDSQTRGLHAPGASMSDAAWLVDDVGGRGKDAIGSMAKPPHTLGPEKCRSSP